MKTKKFNYREYVDYLENDININTMQQYINSKKRLNHHLTSEQRKELQENILPHFIIQMRKEIDKDIKYWYNAPIFRLSYIHCLNMKKPLIDIFKVASEICNRLTEDNNMIAIKRRFKEYYDRMVNIELI
jgi:CRISPR-associated protein Cas8b1/Cst1 subtype I-B